MQKAAAESAHRLSGVLDRADQITREFVEVVGAAIGQVVLRQSPDALIRIQVRCVGRETLDVQPRMLSQQFVEGLTPVGGGVVEEHNHRAPQMPK